MRSTRIELSPPYSVDWMRGYVVGSADSRRTLVLYNSNKDRSSTPYARYLMAVKLGRYLTADETVDHIDGVKSNDCLDNLQVLSLADNCRKSHKKPDVMLTCPVCGSVFTRTMTQLRGKKDRAKRNNIACSRSCGGKLSHITRGT